MGVIRWGVRCSGKHGERKWGWEEIKGEVCGSAGRKWRCCSGNSDCCCCAGQLDGDRMDGEGDRGRPRVFTTAYPARNISTLSPLNQHRPEPTSTTSVKNSGVAQFCEPQRNRALSTTGMYSYLLSRTFCSPTDTPNEGLPEGLLLPKTFWRSHRKLVLAVVGVCVLMASFRAGAHVAESFLWFRLHSTRDRMKVCLWVVNCVPPPPTDDTPMHFNVVFGVVYDRADW